MAHPSREKYFPYLRERLGPNVPFSIDQGWGLWENCKRAWELRDRTKDFHVVIQDDALICEDFMLKAEKFIQKGYKAYSFYFANSPALKKIADIGLKNGYVVREGLHWGVAACLRQDLVPYMMKFGDTLQVPQDDVRIDKFLLGQHIKVCCPMPSLVDHRLDAGSLVGNAEGIRQAMHYIDRV